MKALVVYESMFGNTEQVAGAVATGLARHLDVETVEVTHTPELDASLDLVVVGGPTHAFSMTRPSTRQDAQRQGATHDPSTGIREWLDHLDRGTHAQLVAAFDTRVSKVRHLPGSAARKAAQVAHRSGFEAASKPMSFYVADTSGPLLAGELQRAVEWGDLLGAEVAQRAGR